MKSQDITHCSDECLLDFVKYSVSIKKDGNDAKFWSEKSEPWI